MVLSEDVKNQGYICPKCGGYFRMHAKRRIRMIADRGTFEPLFEGMKISNPLKNSDYESKLKDVKEKTGLDEAVITGKAMINGNEAMLIAMDGRFLMASMGVNSLYSPGFNFSSNISGPIDILFRYATLRPIALNIRFT